jgi:hypothetical protein
VKLLRSDHEIEMRHIGKKRVSPRLRHAAEKTKDDFRATLRDVPEHSHFAERFLLGHVAHAAGIQQNHVRLGFPRRALIATLQQGMRDLFGIALVHLAAVGFDEKFRHRESGL